jgi:hypothetical protein
MTMKKKQTPNRITNVEYLKRFGCVNTTPSHTQPAALIAYTTGDHPLDQHYHRASTATPTITHRVNKLKEAWGVK